VRAPLHIPLTAILEFVASKSAWIEKHRARMEEQVNAHQPRRFQAGELISFLGRDYPLYILRSKTQILRLETTRFVLSADLLPRAAQVLEKWYANQLQLILALRLQLLAQAVGARPQQVRISRARTRWGSCSSKGTLALSWRLAMAPVEIIEYVIVHELAHLRHPDHSRAFWQLVARVLPDYAQRRTWLKKNGHLLSLEKVSPQPLPDYLPGG
jgi:predicted metal-dependent hydrolase